MKILVVIPSHQRKELLGEALDSVAAQTRKPDIVVVTGDTRPGRGYRWVEFDYSTEILATRINRAVAYHECDAFVLLCDDDKLEPTFLEETSALMESTGADVVGTGLRHFGTINRSILPKPAPFVTALFRKSSWAKTKGYREGPYFDWDFNWQLEAAGCTNWQFIAKPLFCYRHHDGNDGDTITPDMHLIYENEIRSRFPGQRWTK